MSIDSVRDGIYIGGMPDDIDDLRRFQDIVLVAPLRPHEADVPKHFKAGTFLYAPFTDDIQAPSNTEKMIAVNAAAFVAASVRQEHDVVVLCREGRNRSGLVVALALTQIHGCSGETAMRIVQARRPHALYNFFFQEMLRGIPATKDQVT